MSTERKWSGEKMGNMSALEPILQNTEASMPKTSRAVPLYTNNFFLYIFFGPVS